MIRRLGAVMACLLVATTGVAALPSPAIAGYYTVTACHQNGVNNSWQVAGSSGFAAAYVECPGGVSVNGHLNEGMVARNTGGPGLAPGFAQAKVVFEAPPDAQVVHIAGEINQNSGSGGWLAGIYNETHNAWASCTLCGTGGSWVRFGNGFGSPAPRRVSALAVCIQGSGCARDRLYGYVALRNMEVVVEETSAPAVAIRPVGLAAGGWRRGMQNLVVDATDPVGIRTTRPFIDGALVRNIIHACDFTRTVPCTNATSVVPIDTRTLRDGRHEIEAIADDAAENPRVVSRVVSTDNTAPTPPAGLTVGGGSGWKSANSFSLGWSNPRPTFAPIVRAFVAVCPVGKVGVGGCPTTTLTGAAASARGISVPGPGRWLARVWLQDAAGNSNPSRPAEVSLQFDDQAPTLMIRRPAADRPTLVRVAATDRGSGIGSREILLRRRGTRTWRALPVTAEVGGFSTVVNDEKFPDGTYQLRARAVDPAGNERSTERLSDGKLAELALPLRIKTRLIVGRPKRVRARGSRGGRPRYRIKLVEAPRAAFGRIISLRGRLTSPGGNPLSNREVRVLERTRVPSAPWRSIATIRTSRSRRFRFKALRGPSRTLRFRFGGSETIRGRTSDVRLGVRAATSLHVSRRRVVNGEDVTFRGRLDSRPLPSTGKLVELQAYARGRWLTFKTVRANPRTGRWAYPYRFSATRGHVRYRFRARIPRELGYPYETGMSRIVKVSVDGQ